MMFETAVVDQKTSFIYFVYPFLFEASEFEARVKAIDGATVSGAKRDIPLWEPHTFPTDDLLAHIANYLDTNRNPPTVRYWKLNYAALNTLGFTSKFNWKLRWETKGEIPFTFGEKGEGTEAVQLILFQVGVGFAVVQTQPKDTSKVKDTNKVNDWLDFLHFFRFIKTQRNVRLEAEQQIWNEATRQKTWEPFFPQLSQEANGSRQCNWNIILSELLRSGSLEGESGVWWQEVFVPGQMLPFTALYVDNIDTTEIPYLRYRLHNFFNANQGDDPAPEDLVDNHPALLPYAKKQWFICSLEGSAFLACDVPQENPFFRGTLPSHLSKQYFLLFLLALHQRFALISLSTTVAQKWKFSSDSEADVQNNTAVFKEIRNRLLAFTAWGYFTQAMQREHHHRCYRKWQEVFLLEQLYREVNDEVREMQEYSQLQYLQRQEAAQRERDRQRLEEIRQQDEAAKERDRQRQEEMRRQDETAKERERLYLLALREKEEADRERDRISVLALREKEEADKEWQRIYSQQLRAKEEAEQERDRQLQNAVYIASAGLGTGAIVASSAGLITASSPITVRLLLGGSLHPFGVAVILSLLAAAGVGGGVWAWRKARLRMSDRAFQQKLEKFKQLLSQNQELFSPDDRESLGELVKAQPDGVCQLWGAIADWQRQNPSHPASSQILWIQSKPPLLSTAKQWAKSLGQWLRYPLFLFVDSCQPENYQEELLKEIKPPTPSEKKVEAFIQLVGCRDLLSSEDSKNLQEEASHWPEKVEGLAEAIGNWCQVPGRSRIYEKLLELQKDSMRNQTNRGEKDYKARLQGAIDSL